MRKLLSGPTAKYGLGALAAGLVIVLAFLAHAAFSSGGGASSGPLWRPFGLPGATVHGVVLDRRGQPAFAATQNGVYRYAPGHGWTRVLKAFGVWSVALLPDNRTVLAGENDGHLDRSTDVGSRWQRRLLTPQGVYAVTVDPRRPAHILAGAGGGVYLSLDGGRRWRRSLHLHNTAIAAFAWLPGVNGAVFAGAISGGSGGSGAVYVSRDGGLTWHVYGHGLQSEGGIMSLTVLDGRHPHLVAGTMGNAAAEAVLAYPAWHKTAGGMPPQNNHVAAIAADPAQPGTLFAGTLAYGVFVSHDGSENWTSLSRGLPEQANAKIVLSLAYSPTQHALYAGTINGVYVLHHVP